MTPRNRARRSGVGRAMGRAALAAAVIAAVSCNDVHVDVHNDVQIHGVDFGPFVDGSDPGAGARASLDEMRRLVEVVAPRVTWLRTYGTTGGLELAPDVAREHGLRIAVGAWLSRDEAQNRREIDGLIALANAGKVDIAVVGSETLLRADLPADRLIAYIDEVRRSIPAGIPVTTADDCDRLLANPGVLDAVDVVFMNHYAYYAGDAVTCAVRSLHGCYQRLAAAVGGTPIVVSETGWPTCGNTILEAEATLAAAREYAVSFRTWADAIGVPYFYFEAFDEPWKERAEGPQGSCWGLWSSDAELKPGLGSIFDASTTVADNWSAPFVPGGPGEPVIELTSVPARGSFADLRGRVQHVSPDEYRVAVYIHVGGWWTKPYFATPLTTINCNGAWEADITTGGADQNAARVAAFLVPVGYEPPLLGGQGSFPAELIDAAVASVEVVR